MSVSLFNICGMYCQANGIFIIYRLFCVFQALLSFQSLSVPNKHTLRPDHRIKSTPPTHFSSKPYSTSQRHSPRTDPNNILSQQILFLPQKPSQNPIILIELQFPETCGGAGSSK